MSAIAIPALVRPEHVVEFLAEYISRSSLPIAYVAKYDEPLRPEYPCVQIMAGPMQKEIHATHTWALTLRAEIYVLHALMTEDRATRNEKDLELATQVVAFLEKDMALGDRIIQGWVEAETPGAGPRPGLGAVIISTRLTWAGINEARF